MSSLSPLKPLLSDPADHLLLKGLNPEQREAVLTTEGPLLIIAGAGTGKTRVIAHRIAYLLQTKKDLKAENILALAFSRKSAAEMLERVENLLGGKLSGDLEIATFHGFCHRFLQDYAMETGLPSRFQLLDKIESWIFFRRLLPELKLSLHWNPANPADCIDGFLRFIGRAKDELVSPEEYTDYAGKVTDPQQRAKAAEVERAYRVYQRQMLSSGCLDFGDLIVRTHQVLRGKPFLLEQLKAKYRYVLVDEFQDTNVAQIALLNLLAGPEGNICVVGDDDQAIYRFRGASFASFLLMKDVFPRVRTIRLTRNYRATKNILSVSNRLIGYNGSDRYDPDKFLTTENPAGSPVEVIVTHDDRHEAQLVTKTILQLYKALPEDQRRFDRFAILYRAHVHRTKLVEALREAQVPFTVQGGVFLFDSLEIKELLSFLRVVNDPDDSVELFRVLSHPLWDIPLDDLVSLSKAAKGKKISLYEVLTEPGNLGVSDRTKDALDRFLHELLAFRKKAARFGVGDLIPAVAEESSLKVLFRLPLDGLQDPLVSLGRFLRLVYRYLQAHPKELDLGAFLKYLDDYLDAGGGNFVDAEDEDFSRADRVRLMSVHQAKGLEFDFVFLPALVQGRFPTRIRPEPISFPVELMKERLPGGDYHLQEERRLCYVACTRAKQKLFVLTRDRAYHRPSSFVREMLEVKEADGIIRRDAESFKGASGDAPGEAGVLERSPHAASLFSEKEILRLVQEVRKLGKEDKESFDAIVLKINQLVSSVWGDNGRKHLLSPEQKFPPQEKLSFTQLETFKYCPLKYRFAYTYHIPIKPPPYMTFGVDIHACLEGFFKQVMNGHIPPLQELLDTFKRCYTQGRYGDTAQEQEYQRRGVEMLTVFYKKHEGAFPVPLYLERPFLLPLGNASIKGVMDRIDPLPDGGVEILDYKTGKPKEKATEEEQLQLRLYALAVKEVFGLEPKRISFYYLQTNEKLCFPQKEEVLVSTKQKLRELVDAVRFSDFSPTPDIRKCQRCEFKNLCPASMA